MTTTEMQARIPAAQRPGRVDGPLRLTRRGRIVVVVAVVLVLLGGLVALGPSVIALSDDADVPSRTVTVQPGETLWDIAGRVNPDGDVRGTVEDIAELNDISDAGSLQIGAELSVPRY